MHYRDLTVQVTDANYNPLPEFGTRRRESPNTNMTTCYIQSKTNQAFQIKIVPGNSHYERFDASRYASISDSEDEDYEDYDVDQLEKTGSGRNKRIDRYVPSYSREHKYHSSNSTRIGGGSRHRTWVQRNEQEWHLLATLTLNGRKDHEKQVIIYMDRNHENFHFSNGVHIIKSRTYKGKDGVLRECGWIFKEVGIENVFEQLMLSDRAGPTPAQNEEELAKASRNLGGSHLEDQKESKVGQIEVSFQRVILGETTHDNDFPDHIEDQHRHGEFDSLEISKMEHAAARDGTGRRVRSHGTIEYKKLSEQQFAWATFRFYYRSEDVLRNMGFPDFQRPGSESPLTALMPKKMEPEYIFDSNGKMIGVIDIPVTKKKASVTAVKAQPENEGSMWTAVLDIRKRASDLTEVDEDEGGVVGGGKRLRFNTEWEEEL